MKDFVEKFKKNIPLPIKQFLVHGFKPFIAQYKLKKKVREVKAAQKEILEQVRRKEVVKVIFLVIHDAVWKYEEVYKLLDKDPRFKPQVVVIPLVRQGVAVMDVFNNTLSYFREHNYNTLSSFDQRTNTWLDIKELTQPDLVFFTNPHKITFDKYYIDNYLDKLTCYVPYAFVVIHAINMHYNQRFHHFLWRHFIETKYHKTFSKKFQIGKISNVRIVGFPGLDKIYATDYKPKNVWKTYRNGNAKKIIWAPHHTISGQGSGLDYSSFTQYYDYFMQLAKTRDDLQIAFKPHPFLKQKLYKDGEWGKEKTNEYYASWDSLPNTQFEDGEYMDLFRLSDAMIMDSASFIVEYLYFDKPILFTMTDDSVKDRFNSFGKMVFDYLYTAKTKEKVNLFLENQVFKGNDSLREIRNIFLKKEVLPKNKKTASENILTELKNKLSK